jgi:hypothetical protein
MIRIIMLVLISVLLAASCQQDKKTAVTSVEKPVGTAASEEASRIKDTVVLYDALLAKGYITLNMSPLLEVATEQRANKAYYHMAALGEGKVKMDMKLNELKFSDVKTLSPETAEAATEEKWDYRYINTDSGKQVYDNSVEYKLTYRLIKQSGKWLIDDIEVTYTKQKNPEEYTPLTGKRDLSGSATDNAKESKSGK